MCDCVRNLAPFNLLKNWHGHPASSREHKLAFGTGCEREKTENQLFLFSVVRQYLTRARAKSTLAMSLRLALFTFD